MGLWCPPVDFKPTFILTGGITWSSKQQLVDLFVQQLVQANYKEDIEALCITGPLWQESSSDW